MQKFLNKHGATILAGVIVGVTMLVIQYFIKPKIEDNIKKRNKT